MLPPCLPTQPCWPASLTYHVVPGRVFKAEVPVGSPITTAQGDTLTVNASLQITDQWAALPTFRPPMC